MIGALVWLMVSGVSVDACDAASAEVRRTERAWLDAYEAANAASMSELVADGFVITYPDGRRQGKLDVIAGLSRRPAGATLTLRTEDISAACHGPVVVLRGRVTQSSSRGEVRSLYTDTYFREGPR